MIKIGIVGAMDVEVEGICRSLSDLVLNQVCGLDFLEGRLSGSQVVVVRSGVGKVNAAMCAQLLISRFNVTHIINTGVAGALASGLGVLDLVVSREVMYHDVDATNWGYESCTVPGMSRTFLADCGLVELAYETCRQRYPQKRVLKGLVASGDQFVGSNEMRERIRSLCQPDCVEMEGAAIGHVATVNGIPFVVIRCMSDMADDHGEETARFNEKEGGAVSATIVCAMVRALEERWA